MAIPLTLLCACSGLNTKNGANIDNDPYSISQIGGNPMRISGYEQQTLRNIRESKRQYIKMTETLSGNIARQWSKEDVSLPSTSTYVKYSDNYKSKASINFGTGAIRVETIETSNPDKALEKAITNMLLLPQNPNNVDLFSDEDFKFDGKPFLAGLVKDQNDRDILTQEIARSYAQYLTKNKLQTRNDSSGKRVSYVDIQMVGDYQSKSEHKYEEFVLKYAKQYNVSPALILGIIQTESNFNPYAVSGAPAFGLMQVVPSTAGADAYELINGKKGMPTKEMLFNPETNIQYGTAYLSILFNRYLPNIQDKDSQEYCVITSYNAGAGTVFKAFHRDRKEAVNRINSLSSSKVYEILRTQLASEEGRRYLLKVTTFKKNYVHIK